MKKMMIALAVSAFALTSHAKTLKPSDVKLSLSSIDQVIRLVRKEESGSSDRKLNLVITDTGMSTDVSPRIGIYLALASWAEMGNISAEYDLTNTALKFISAKRKAPGIFEIKYLDSTSLNQVTMTVDARSLQNDERKARAACGDDFCDKSLNSEIKITEVVSKR
jgi:hypothetical protein